MFFLNFQAPWIFLHRGLADNSREPWHSGFSGGDELKTDS